MNIEIRDGVSQLLADTGRAHHDAFATTDGADPDWPIWYADHSRDGLAERFGINLTRSELIYCLMNAHYEHEARSSSTEWSDFYADEIVDPSNPFMVALRKAAADESRPELDRKILQAVVWSLESISMRCPGGKVSSLGVCWRLMSKQKLPWMAKAKEVSTCQHQHFQHLQ